MSESLDTAVGVDLVIPISFFIVVFVLTGLGIVPGLLARGANVHWILQLLLFLDPDYVIGSKHFFRILSNDMTSDSAEDAEESLKFCERICAAVPEPLMFTDGGLTVHSCNRAALQLLGKRPKDILKKPLLGVLAGSATLRPLLQAVNQALQGFEEPLECDLELATRHGPKTVRTSIVPISSAGELQQESGFVGRIAIFAIIFKDLPSFVVTHAALERERKKVQELLALVLPPRIMEMRKAHRHEPICFPVPHAAFLQVDILPSAEWRESRKPDTVLAMIHETFATLDLTLDRFSEMTKVKTINGTYLAAAGLFSEASQPDLLAKQAVLAGLTMVSSLNASASATQANLTARVGICLKAPVLVLVLELDIPSFEIVGAPHAALQQLTDAGEPFDVTIAENIYDLIYGAGFQIKVGQPLLSEGKTLNSYVVTSVE
jgi:class 3 adenylate cyclase/PAS domain-containing protein